MVLTPLAWIAGLLLIGAPLAGMIAVIALAVFHEHTDPVRRAATARPGSAAPRAVLALMPVVGRRASADLFEDYLLDEQGAPPPVESLPVASLRVRAFGPRPVQGVRASTWLLEDHLQERAKGPAAPPPAAPQTPALAAPRVRAGVARPVRRVPALAYERAPRPTRLMPLSPEIAVG